MCSPTATGSLPGSARCSTRGGPPRRREGDAGVGGDRAGIGGLDYLQELGIAAATIGHDTARIGDGADMLARGVITHANALAMALGVRPGLPCAEAAALLKQAQPSDRPPPEALESAFLLVPEPTQVWALDSASLVLP